MKRFVVPDLPKAMPRMEKRGTFAQRCNWEAVAREHIQIIRKAARKTGKFDTLNLSEDMLKRRARAAVDYTDRIIERYQELPGYGPEVKDETGDEWLYLNLLPLITYNHIETRSYLLFAASVWILDEILLPEDPEKRKQLFRLLPKNDRDIDGLFNIPDCWHPCYDYDLILSVMYVLYHRNGDPAAEMDDEDTGRVVISSLEAKGIQHTDEPGRKTFDELMALIPEESVRRAAGYFEELFWQWTDRYVDCLGVMLGRYRDARERMNGLADEYNRLRMELKDVLDDMAKQRKSGNSSPKQPVVNPLLMNPVPENPFDQFMGGGNAGFPGGFYPADTAAGKALEISERMDVIGDRTIQAYDLLNEIDRQKRSFVFDLAELGCMHPDECGKEYGPEVAGKMKPLKILYPFEVCFALLWLIDSGSDLPWLCGCGVGLMQEVAESLPWGVFEYKEYRDPVWNPDDEEFKENLRLAAAKPSSIPEWYERSIVPRKGEMFSFNRSMAQVLYEETGCLMPRDIRKYDGRQKMFRKYGISAKDMNSLLLLSTALSHARRSERALNFDEDVLQIWDEWEQKKVAGGKKHERKEPAAQPLTEEELAEQVKLLREENRKLRVSLHEAERSARDIRKELLSARSDAELDHRELADLRELVFNQEHEASEEEIAEAETANFPYEVRKATVVFGGHDSWLKAIRPMLAGNIRFFDREVFSVDVIRNADVVWIQPNAMSHSQYYRVVDAARQYGKPVRYFTYAGAAKGAVQLMEAEQ